MQQPAVDHPSSRGLPRRRAPSAVVDEGGVALAAIQGLNEKLEARSQKLEVENAALKQSLAELKQLVQSLAEKK